MMRSIILLVFLSLISCKNDTTEKKEIFIESKQELIQSKSVALNFINNYVAFCNDRNSNLTLIEWVNKQSTVSDDFKSQLKSTIEKAEMEDPEMGLGFDPIFDAQDYPTSGFELVKIETLDDKNELVVVKGIDWSDFKLNIKMVFSKGEWFVNGCGIINVTEN